MTTHIAADFIRRVSSSIIPRFLKPERCWQHARFISSSIQGSDLQEEGRLDDLYRHIKLKCSSHEKGVLDSYQKFVESVAENLNISHVETTEPFRLIKRRTMLASRHVHKKYRRQYETRFYYRDILFKNLTGSTADTFLEYVERNLPEGTHMIVEKHKLAKLDSDISSNQNKEI